MDLSLSRSPTAPASPPAPLAASLGAVLLLHAALLWQPWHVQPGTPPVPPMHVRVVQAATAFVQQQVAAGPAVAAGTPAGEPRPSAEDTTEPVAAAPEAALPSLAGPPVPSDAAAASTAAEDYYRPRSELTTPPEPIVMIQVLFPTSFQEKGDYSAQLSLFIDETGRVRRVRVDTLGLPPVLQEAASQAFLNAYFQPGRVEGQAVKSLMRVEVAFENPPA